MFPEQLIPELPEAPLIPDSKKYTHVHVSYKGKDTEYIIPKSIKVSEIILHASSKLHYWLTFPADWQNFSFFIGFKRINENREIGFYRGLLSSNFHTIRVEDKPQPIDMAQKIMNQYSFDEIERIFNMISECKEATERSNESSEEMYKSYLAHKDGNDE